MRRHTLILTRSIAFILIKNMPLCENLKFAYTDNMALLNPFSTIINLSKSVIFSQTISYFYFCWLIENRVKQTFFTSAPRFRPRFAWIFFIRKWFCSYSTTFHGIISTSKCQAVPKSIGYSISNTNMPNQKIKNFN